MLVLRSMVLSDRKFETFNLKLAPYQTKVSPCFSGDINYSVSTLFATMMGAGNTPLIREALEEQRKESELEIICKWSDNYDRRNPSGEMYSLVTYNVVCGPTVTTDAISGAARSKVLGKKICITYSNRKSNIVAREWGRRSRMPLDPYIGFKEIQKNDEAFFVCCLLFVFDWPLSLDVIQSFWNLKAKIAKRTGM